MRVCKAIITCSSSTNTGCTIGNPLYSPRLGSRTQFPSIQDPPLHPPPIYFQSNSQTWELSYSLNSLLTYLKKMRTTSTVVRKFSGKEWKWGLGGWNSSKENTGVILESYPLKGWVGAKFCISPKWSQQLQHVICGNSFRIWKGFQSHAGSCLLSPHSIMIEPLVPFIELFSPNKTLNAGLSNCSRITRWNPPSRFLLILGVFSFLVKTAPV